MNGNRTGIVNLCVQETSVCGVDIRISIVPRYEKVGAYQDSPCADLPALSCAATMTKPIRQRSYVSPREVGERLKALMKLSRNSTG